MIAPLGTTAAVALVGRVGGVPGGQVVIALKELPKGGAGSVTVDNPSRFSRLTAVLVNADSKITNQASSTRDFIYARDRQPYYARVTTDFTAPRVLRSAPAPGAHGVKRNAAVKVTFSEPVLGVSTKSLQLVGAGGRVVGTHVKFTAGSRVATLTPNGALGRAKRYKVRVTQAVTDTAVNPLARTTVWSFSTAR
jgi:limonene-1,2-epoxide hydrolase